MVLVPGVGSGCEVCGVIFGSVCVGVLVLWVFVCGVGCGGCSGCLGGVWWVWGVGVWVGVCVCVCVVCVLYLCLLCCCRRSGWCGSLCAPPP